MWVTGVQTCALPISMEGLGDEEEDAGKKMPAAALLTADDEEVEEADGPP